MARFSGDHVMAGFWVFTEEVIDHAVQVR